jgi:hypothetical protein
MERELSEEPGRITITVLHQKKLLLANILHHMDPLVPHLRGSESTWRVAPRDEKIV